jgi:expansin
MGIGACGEDDPPAPSSSSKTASTVDGGSGTSSSGSGSSSDAGSGETNSGEATYYNAEGKGACGIQTPADYLVCAINDEQYSKENCGRCVEVTGPSGKSVIVRIIDKCPGCDSGDLDLSETAFTKIAAKSAGRVKISWRFVACP